MRGARLPVVATIWAGSFFLAFDRVNISLAAPDIMRDIVLDGAQMGLVLSMYYWGYTFGNFAGGLVSPTLRLRGLTSLLIVVWAALTAVTGLCNLLWQFCVVRVLFGIAEGATANLMHRLQNNWLLPAERGRGYGIFIGFVYLGIALGMPLVGALIKLADWRVMFLLSAVLTLALAAVFWFMVRDHPWQHPRVPAPEGQQFQDIITRDRVTLADSPPELTLAQRLPALFAIPSFAWLCVASFFVIGVYFTNMSWLPGYLVKERGYTVLGERHLSHHSLPRRVRRHVVGRQHRRPLRASRARRDGDGAHDLPGHPAAHHHRRRQHHHRAHERDAVSEFGGAERHHGAAVRSAAGLAVRHRRRHGRRPGGRAFRDRRAAAHGLSLRPHRLVLRRLRRAGGGYVAGRGGAVAGGELRETSARRQGAPACGGERRRLSETSSEGRVRWRRYYMQ
jgi:hypothetical protein